MTKNKPVIVERDRTPVQSDQIYRLMEGDGNQSRINDGQPSAS